MRIKLESEKDLEVVDITDRIESVLENETGLCSIFVKHTTAGLTINEAEERLLEDIEGFLEEMVPERKYRHDQIDDNASSHLRNLLIDSEVTVPIKNGDLELGTWQSVLFVELDGPRKRSVEVTVLEK